MSGIEYRVGGVERSEGGKKIYFGHGDELERFNYSYQLYKSIIRSYPLKTLANWVPYSVIEKVGTWMSKTSKGHNKKKYQFQESSDTKASYRSHMDYWFKNTSWDMIVCGHSHVSDHYQNNDKQYLNNGYAQHTKTFLYLNNFEPEFVALAE